MLFFCLALYSFLVTVYVLGTRERHEALDQAYHQALETISELRKLLASAKDALNGRTIPGEDKHA